MVGGVLKLLWTNALGLKRVVEIRLVPFIAGNCCLNVVVGFGTMPAYVFRIPFNHTSECWRRLELVCRLSDFRLGGKPSLYAENYMRFYIFAGFAFIFKKKFAAGQGPVQQ